MLSHKHTHKHTHTHPYYVTIWSYIQYRYSAFSVVSKHTNSILIPVLRGTTYSS